MKKAFTPQQIAEVRWQREIARRLRAKSVPGIGAMYSRLVKKHVRKSMDAFAFIPVCRPALRPPEALAELQKLGLRDVSLENKLEVRNQNGEYEISLTGAVGKSWWDESGISADEFRDALGVIPKGSRITLLINSEGGSVQVGINLYNQIKERSAEITARITGYAVSIASVFPLAAGKVVSPKSAIWMMHRAWSYAQGNDEDMENAAAMLREHNKMLVEIYVAETGKTAEEWEAWMRAETWVRGSKAVEYGLADETDEDESQAAYRPLHPDFIQRCKNLSPEILNAISSKSISAPPMQGERKNNNQQQKDTDMNRAQRIALLNAWGVMVKDEAGLTDARLDELIALGKSAAAASFGKHGNSMHVADSAAAPSPATAEPAGPATKAEIEAAMAQLRKDMLHENGVRSELTKLVTERRITQATADKLTEAAIKDATVLAALRENPQMPVAAEPIGPDFEVFEATGDASITDIASGIRASHAPTKAWQRGESVTMKTLAAASVRRAGIIVKHMSKLNQVMAAGTNTIATELKRDVILQTIITDFVRRLLPLRMFSTVFSNVPLEGTNKLQIPFYDLDTGASTSFKGSDGYIAGDSTTDNREVQIGKRADADVLDDTKKYDRKYQMLSVTSEEMARQPYLNVVQLNRLKAEKLASDIVAHVLGIVTAAEFGAAAITKVAALFTSSDLADLKLACKLWPEMGRGLVLDSAYDAALLKDVAFKHALNAASDSAIKEGRLNPRVFGFDYVENPTIPANGENLVGFAVFMSAILFGQAPVPPAEEVRNDGTNYTIVTDPATGISFEYRTFGNSQMDSGAHIIEASYGFAKGNGNALKRIVSA